VDLRTTLGITEFNLALAAENGHRHGFDDIQVVALNPVLVNAVWHLKRERQFIRSHQLDRGKPPLERIGVELQSDAGCHFPPYSMAKSLRRNHLFTSFLWADQPQPLMCGGPSDRLKTTSAAAFFQRITTQPIPSLSHGDFCVASERLDLPRQIGQRTKWAGE
jgi:hypothetical protein